jgi:hypothetical protein
LSEPSRLLLSTVVEVLAKLSDDLVSAVDEGKEIDYQRAGPLLQLVVLQFVIGIVFVESFVEIALQLFDCFPQHLPSRVGLLTLLDQFFQFGHFDPHFFVDKINGRQSFGQPSSYISKHSRYILKKLMLFGTDNHDIPRSSVLPRKPLKPLIDPQHLPILCLDLSVLFSREDSVQIFPGYHSCIR